MSTSFRTHELLLLSGFMGTGKSTVGRLVAERTGLPFFDLDELVEAAAGRSIEAIFTADGELGFRAIERTTLRDLLARTRSGVIALGGGSLLDARTREEALERGFVVTLTASPATIAQRIQRGPRRPLLAGPHSDVRRIAELCAERAPVYAEAHARLSSEGSGAEAVAEAVVRAFADPTLRIPLGRSAHSIRVSRSADAATADVVAGLDPSSVFVVSDETVRELHGAGFERALSDRLLPLRSPVTIAPGEPTKSLGTVERLLAHALAEHADRRSIFVAHGGGVVSDITGFAASILFRGVRWVGVPTTLLAMVDASVGGKTGVDFGGAKNAIGSFHQPSAVIIDPSRLLTESDRSYRSGLAEVVKSAAIGDAALFDQLERSPDDAVGRSPETVREMVQRSVAVKARIVAADEREDGIRAHLNFGHTLGHALEAEGNFTERTHGEAVALGMVAMLRVGVRLGVTDADVAERCTLLLARLGLPVRLESPSIASALRWIELDKKRAASEVRVVFLRTLGEPLIYPIPMDSLKKALIGAAAAETSH